MNMTLNIFISAIVALMGMKTSDCEMNWKFLFVVIAYILGFSFGLYSGITR